MEISTKIIKLRKNQWISKTVLKAFIIIVLITVILRIIISAFFDLGFYNNEFHIGFYNNPKLTFQDEYNAFKNNNPNSGWEQFLDQNHYLKNLIAKHPHNFWNLTQFTWITTVFLFLILVLRYLIKTNDRIPSWLKWTTSQETIVLIASYELIVMIVFWGWTFQSDLPQNALSIVEFSNSIIVHTIVPLLTLSYLIIDIFISKKLLKLKRQMPKIGIIYPAFYLLHYLLIAITWRDPYGITDINNYFQALSKIDGSKEIFLYSLKVFYIAPLVILGMYIYFKIFVVLYNFRIKKLALKQ